jgi:multiple sugar transport system permease protein
VSLIPLYWMATGSFKTQTVTVRTPPELFPSNPTLENWQLLLTSQLPTWQWLANSLIVAGLTTAVVIVVSSAAGWAFAKLPFPGSQILFLLLLATMMLPPQVILVPMYALARALGLYNTHVGMILPMVVSPFGIFLVRQFAKSIPNELLDAATIDGASEFQSYRFVGLPLIRPALAALAIFTFSVAWNNFMWQQIMAGDVSMATLPVGVAAMARTAVGEETVVNIGVLMAGGTFGALPMIVVFLLFQRHFVRGITIGAVKG